MKNVRFFLSVLLCFALLFTFFSCEDIDAKRLEAEAAVKLLEAPYVLDMEMNMSYSGDDSDSLIGSDDMETSLSMNIDGTRFKMNAGSGVMQIEYIFVDNILYMNMMGSKLRTEMSAAEVEDMLGAGASGIGKMSECSFSHVKTQKGSDGKITISYKGLEGDGNELIASLIKDISGVGDGEDAVILEKSDFEYVAVIDKDGRYESMEIIVVMNTSVEGEKLSLIAKMNMRFDYENAVKVSAPEDADEYYDVGDIGDIFE